MALTEGKEVEQVLQALKRNRFERVEYVPDAASAVKLVLEIVPPGASIGVPGSTTVRQLRLIQLLRERGHTVTDLLATSAFTVEELGRKIMAADVLLASSNALTLDGKLVNIDFMGNRVAAMIFGPKMVILIIGMNKLVRDTGEAIKRIKNVITPYHVKISGGKGPCGVLGYCTDCDSPGRFCGVTTIIEKRPPRTNMNIILVGADLGLGWDPAWPEERRERIAAAYREKRLIHTSTVQSAPS